jgi:hypothetical protein
VGRRSLLSGSTHRWATAKAFGYFESVVSPSHCTFPLCRSCENFRRIGGTTSVFK